MSGVVLVFVDERGHPIAHAADFERQAPGGYSVQEAQRHRARRALALAVVGAYASPNLVRAFEWSDADRLLERLCRLHGCRVHEVLVGVGGDAS